MNVEKVLNKEDTYTYTSMACNEKPLDEDLARTDNDVNKRTLLLLLKAEVRQFSENTTIRGIPRIVKSKSKSIKMLWTCFVVLLFIGCATCILFLTRQFHEHHVMHPPRVLSDQPSPFPAVTVCNLRPFSKKGKQRLRDKHLRTPRDFGMHLNSYLAHYLYNNNRTGDYMLMTSLINLAGYLESVNESDLAHFGHSLKDFLVSCHVTVKLGDSRNQDSCDKYGNWTTLIHAQYMNCFTYNLHEELVNKAKIMEIYVYIDDDLESIHCVDCFRNEAKSQVSGAALSIHTPQTYPNTYQDSINLMPNSLTEIKLQIIKNQHMTPPFGRCNLASPAVFDLYGRPFMYTEQACRMITVQKDINEHCQCMAMEYPQTSARLPYCGQMPIFMNTSRCTGLGDAECLAAIDTALTHIRCKTNVTAAYNQDVLTQCPLPCESFTYDSDRSTSSWPTKSWQLNWLESNSHLLEKPELSDYRTALDLMRRGNETGAGRIIYNSHVLERNLLAILINRPNFDVHFVEEKEVLSLTSFLSQLGGLLSMWVGLTMISVVEVLELLVRCCYGMLPFKNRHRRHSLLSPHIQTSST